PELVSEIDIPVDRGLRGLRGVLEYTLPGRERGEGERVAHVDLARQWQRRGLRPRAARDEGRALPERGAQRLRNVVAVEHGDERDRPAAFGEHEVEQLELGLVHHADLARHRDLDRALAALPERVAIGLELLAARVAARQRPALVSEMLVQQRARETERTLIDCFTQKRSNLCCLLRGGRALHRSLAHDVMPERGERREEREVE